MFNVPRNSILRKRSFHALAIMLALPLACFATAAIRDARPGGRLSLSGAYAYEEWLPFDSQSWRDFDGNGSERYLMLPDLLAHHLQQGTPASAVSAMLGNAVRSEHNLAIWYVGPDSRWTSPRPLYLCVEFGGGVVRDVDFTSRLD